MAKQPAKAGSTSGNRFSFPRLRRIVGVGPIACATLVMSFAWCSCSAATTQSQETRSYKAGHAYEAKNAAVYRVSLKELCREHRVMCPGNKTGPITYPASTAQNWCTVLLTGDASFKGDREEWVAGCVSSTKGARFIEPPGPSTVKFKTLPAWPSSNGYTIAVESR